MQDQLINKKDELQSRTEEFRAKKGMMKARYKAAEASSHVSKATTGVDDEMVSTGHVLERAEEQADEMETRSVAVNEFMNPGAFDDALSDRDSIERELETGHTSAGVGTELGTLKTEMDKSSGSSSSRSTSASNADVDVETDVADERAEVEPEELKNEDNPLSS